MRLLKPFRRSARNALLAAAALLVSACADKTYELEEERVPIQVGTTTVDVVIHTSAEPGLTYVNLHDDENTAVEAAVSVLKKHGGRLVELQHTGERNVTFELDDTAYAFDPNRIFTELGVDSTLTRQGKFSEAGREVVTSFADSLLTLIGLDGLTTVVAVHNNSDGGYSALEYAEDGPLARDARFVFVATGSDPDDFFFVTTQNLYNDLRAAGFNVVMQDNALVTDDGSLSVLSGHREIPYANAEAQRGHLEEQRRMLAHLHKLLWVE